jgi:hypothetical protein
MALESDNVDGASGAATGDSGGRYRDFDAPAQATGRPPLSQNSAHGDHGTGDVTDAVAMTSASDTDANSIARAVENRTTAETAGVRNIPYMLAGGMEAGGMETRARGDENGIRDELLARWYSGSSRLAKPIHEEPQHFGVRLNPGSLLTVLAFERFVGMRRESAELLVEEASDDDRRARGKL